MVAVISEPTAIAAPEKPLPYPLRIMAGPRMRASIAASATAEPETPPISVDRRMATWASPPAIQPTATSDTLSSRSVMPLSFIRWPASTKKGTASNGKLWLIVATFWTPIDSGMPESMTKKTNPAIPVANATGMPASISTTKTMEISSMVRAPGFPARPFRPPCACRRARRPSAAARHRPCCRQARCRG